MGRTERKKIIEDIESYHNSKVLVYFVGDRPLLNGRIAGDSIRWLYDHLKNLDNDKKIDTIDLYLYSLGGNLDTPWPIISVLREYCDHLNVLIPYKAFSATTLTALGAEKILMSRKGELGPIDPQMIEEQKGHGPPGTSPVTKPISTEDITSYISFVKDKVGIQDQSALATLTKSLTDTLPPPTLGQVNRVHSHIRAVAGKMLSHVRSDLDDDQIQKLIEALTEKTFIHGHSIGRHEAKEMGLQVEEMDEKLEKMCWDLYLQYEEYLKLHSFANPLAYFENDNQDEYGEENAVIACIESVKKCHEYSGPLLLKKIRQLPPQLSLNMNAPIQLPADIVTQDIPEHVQRMLQQMQQNIANQMGNMIANELKANMPVIGIDLHNEKMMWKEVHDES